MSGSDAERDGLRRRAKAAFDWCFRSRETGRVTLAQPPNVPLGIFFATVVARVVLPEEGTITSVITWIGLAAVGWWALDELLRGVNPWRRLLGLAGCILVVASAVSLAR